MLHLAYQTHADIMGPVRTMGRSGVEDFTTLLRGLMGTMLPEHDVCIAGWHNARDVGMAECRFGFDDYIAHLIAWLETTGPGRTS
jgi:poly-beta-hydroxyalkanoate depolymerase